MSEFFNWFFGLFTRKKDPLTTDPAPLPPLKKAPLPSSRPEVNPLPAPTNVDQLQVTDIGFDLIRSFEGLYLKAYFDEVGVPTIGYGRTAGVTKDDVHNSRTCTKADAEAWLKQDVEAEGSHFIRAWVKIALFDYEFSALASFIYNCGAGTFKSSGVLAAINDHNFAAALTALRGCTHAGGEYLAGLDRRRKAEEALFRKDFDLMKQILKE